MPFELSPGHHDRASLVAAMRALDPLAKVALDEGQGRFEVLASASRAQVVAALLEIGCVATPLESERHISGGSTCCGRCG